MPTPASEVEMILLAYGEGTFQVREKVNQALAKAASQGVPVDSISRLDGAEADLDVFRQALTGGSLFSDRQVVVIRDLLIAAPADVADAVIPLLESVPEETIVVLAEYGQPDRRRSAFKAAKKMAAKTWEFGAMDDGAAQRWVRQTAGERGINIEPNAVSALVSLAGTDAWALSSELDKLSSAADGPVTSKLVNELVTADISGDVFDLVDSLGRRDARRALGAWANLMASGEAPLRVLAMIVRQYRILLAVKSLADSGASDGDIARELAKPPRVVGNLPPFVIRKAKQQSSMFTDRELRDNFEALADLDWQIKTGRRDAEAAIELFIAEACQAELAKR